jgi:hypothetical protein
MREVASKAATLESTVGLSKVRDDIPSLRATTPPLIAVGGYRVRIRRPRLIRAAAIAPLAVKPIPLRGSLAALFAGVLSLAVLAGPVTCPTCTPVHADGQLDAERIAAAVSTAAINPAPHRMLDSTPAAAADEATREPSDKGPPQVEIAAATMESQPEPPLSPVANRTLTSKNITPDGPALRARASHRHVSIKRHRAKARIPADKYRQAPAWAAKMFETNWQDKAFAYQYETHSLPSSWDRLATDTEFLGPQGFDIEADVEAQRKVVDLI